MVENTTILQFVLLHQVPERPTPPVTLIHLPPLFLCCVSLPPTPLKKYIRNMF